MRSADTSPEIHALQLDVYRSMSPERRVSIAVEMSEEVFAIAASGIRARHARYGDDEVRWALLRLRLGDDLFREVWPDAPLVAP
ncbi:MAG TPA: hypothetical protein VGJ86_20695 [Acidimicrobiales bacterium]